MIGIGRVTKEAPASAEVSIDIGKLSSFISGFHRRKREERAFKLEEQRKQSQGGGGGAGRPKIMSGPVAGKLKKFGYNVEQR